jgi:hypothetical protein
MRSAQGFGSGTFKCKYRPAFYKCPDPYGFPSPYPVPSFCIEKSHYIFTRSIISQFQVLSNYFSVYVMPRCTVLKRKKFFFSDLDPELKPNSGFLRIQTVHPSSSSISEGVISPAKSESLFPGSATSYPITSRVGPPHKRVGGVLHRPASLFIQSNSSLNTADSIMSSSYGLSGKTFYSKLLLC